MHSLVHFSPAHFRLPFLMGPEVVWCSKFKNLALQIASVQLPALAVIAPAVSSQTDSSIDASTQGESSVLSRLFLGGTAPLYCPNIPPYQCFRGSAPPIRVIACKADLYSIITTKQLYTCKYTAINCTIVTLAEDRGWIRD